jgi:phosphoribosylformylglycinamidine cyclo-ligase
MQFLILLDAGNSRHHAPNKKILDKYTSKRIHGMVQWRWSTNKILHFVENLYIIKDNLFPVPTLFQLIRNVSARLERDVSSFVRSSQGMYAPEAVAQDIIEPNSFNDAQSRGGSC